MSKLISTFLLLALTSYSLAKELDVKTLTTYNLPINKQGIADHHASLLNDKRYNVLKSDLQIDLKKFSYYWRDAEDKLMSSPAPLICPKEYILFPKDMSQKYKLGIKNYHCYKDNALKNPDNFLVEFISTSLSV